MKWHQQKFPLVIVESPYAGDIERNTTYAQRALHDCIMREEAPYASHLLYPQPHVLDENDPDQRVRGILLGYEWWHVANYIVFYTDYGWTDGMEQARDRAIDYKKPYQLRHIGRNDDPRVRYS